MIENPRTGEQVEFRSEAPELLVRLSTWTRPGHRAAEHVHPGMEERFESWRAGPRSASTAPTPRPAPAMSNAERPIAAV